LRKVKIQSKENSEIARFWNFTNFLVFCFLIDKNELESEKGTLPNMDISKKELQERYSSAVTTSANIPSSAAMNVA
jgi:hypothetical protein